EAALGAVQRKPRRVDAGDVAGAAVHEQALSVCSGIMQRDVEGVLDGGLVAIGADAAGEGRRRAKEKERLIDQMRAEVEEHAVGWITLLLPGVLAGRGAEAIEVRLEGDEAADSVFSEQLFDGEKVAVPAAVVEWNNEQALLLG